MRRPTLALAKVVLGTALAATTVLAQQSPPMLNNGEGASSSPPTFGSTTASQPPASPMSPPVSQFNAARGARYLLRNGWDYITYQEYERALAFFREAEQRQGELNDPERLKLRQGIDRAQRGLREAANGMTTESPYARSGPARRPGALALAAPATSATPKPGALKEPSRIEREPIQLAGNAGVSTSNAANVHASAPESATPSESLTTPATIPAMPDVETGQSDAPTAAVQVAQAPTTPIPVPSPTSTPSQGSEEIRLPELPADPGPSASGTLEPTPIPVPAAELPPPAMDLPPAPGVEPPPAPPASSAPAPAPALSKPAEPDPEMESLPPLPSSLGEGPVETPSPGASPAPAPEPAARPEPAVVDQPAPRGEEAPRVAVAPEPPPAPPANDQAPAPAVSSESESRDRSGTDTRFPVFSGTVPSSSLTPELQREVEQIAQRQDEEMRQGNAPSTAPPAAPAEAPMGPGGAGSTRLEVQRAPSSAEARPIRPIPVPEEFVPLPKREWNPNRKYWAAAATCHLPLYFQDATLERYGYSFEQRLGPTGRFLSYPLDSPRQSKQRNQLAQPFFSAGLFAAQIALLPYNLIMDPPWEAEYDLGYYRPGDRVPTDVYYLPLTGVGPPLQGKNYGQPSSRW
ncbi:MAG: hypothetical protein NVSMB9_06100 [Isosphaeraceae bacterium]